MPRNTDKARSSHYLPTLDGWRAVAILIVVLSHDSLHVVGPFSTAWIQRNGRVGVDLFFALSGLLICTRLLREEQASGSISLHSFYTRRFFRIQPAAWLYLAMISILMLTGVLDRGFPGVAASVLLVRNYYPLTLPAYDWFTGHFWSLAVEEHFYLLLPAFLLMVRTYRASVMAALIVLLLCWQVFQFHHPALLFGWAPENHTGIAIAGIFLATLCAVLLQRPSVMTWCVQYLTPYVALAGAAALLYLQHELPRTWTGWLVLAAFPMLIASTMLHPNTSLSRFLQWGPLRFVGVISYSIYLWQMLFFTQTHVHPVVHAGALIYVQDHIALRYAATLLASIGSYYFVEQPMIRLGHRVSSQRVVKKTVPLKGRFARAG